METEFKEFLREFTFKELDDAIAASQNSELSYTQIFENLKKSVDNTLESLLNNDPDYNFQRKILKYIYFMEGNLR